MTRLALLLALPLLACGDNTVAEFYQDRGFSTSTWSPADLPLQPASLADLAGGDRFTNASIIEGLLRGHDFSPRRDAVLLNAGAALFIAGATRSIAEGWDTSLDILNSGAAWELVLALRQFTPRPTTTP